MSHRVTTDTEIKDKALALQACKTAGVSYTEQGDVIRFTSGGLRNASLDLRTGRISGDTDYGHTKDTLGALRQAYSEAKYRYEGQKQGVVFESRTVETVQGIANVIHLKAMVG